MDLLIVALATPLLVIAGITILNTLTFHRLGATFSPAAHNADLPLVSLLIPARNEAVVIEQTVRSLLAQTYPRLEVLILDDHSSDGTGDLARAAANDNPHGSAGLHVLSGQPLPPGWGGKNWACHQLAQAAHGDLLVFTDADVHWTPNAVAALVGHMQMTQADLLTVWSTQRTLTWGERLVVPLMAFVIVGYLPLLAVHHLPLAMFAAANGQCMAFRRRAYQSVGGHSAVKAHIVEDIRLAQAVKRAGLRLRMADGAGRVTCRMYDGWRAVRDGYAKNVRAGYGDSFALLALGTLFHWALFLFPALWLAFGWLLPVPAYPLAPLLLTALGIGVRALTAAVTRQRVLPDALLLPLSVLLMTRIAAQSVYWHVRYGGPRWKGRTLAGEPGK